MRKPDPQRIVAHRGASFDAPENTMAAFDLAWQQGADAIECDVWVTQDQELVCIHDRITKRTADRALDVTTSTLAELRQLDMGRWKGEQWEGEPIPTLSEVLAGVPKEKAVFVEVKDGVHLLPLLQRAVANSRLLPRQVVIISFHKEVIVESKRALPDSKTLLLVALKPNALEKRVKASMPRVMCDLADTGADGLDVAGSDIVDAEFIRQIHNTGREVHVWTVDDASQATRYWIDNIDSITTNRPKLIGKCIGEIGLASPPLKRGDWTTMCAQHLPHGLERHE
jgi:glycerophosphoryl diester phosphodiesterase